MSDHSTDISVTMDRLLRERLEQYGVPVEVRSSLRDDILGFLQRPEKKPHGACVMTPAASMASDQAKKNKEVQKKGTSTPEVI